MLLLDLLRPFRIAHLRNGALLGSEHLTSLGGLLPTRHRELERAIVVAREEAALSKRILFLSRTQQVFHLWHVVHKPFSYTFAVLVLIHIGVVLIWDISRIVFMDWLDWLITLVIAAALSLFFLRGYMKGLKKRDEHARRAAEKGKLFSHGPSSQHPHIDTNQCIGCATCTTVCPEGDVLGPCWRAKRSSSMATNASATASAPKPVRWAPSPW
jgi:4Fe-4S binding domain